MTQNQAGRTQGSFGGVGWLDLSSYSISSGTLKVQLTNSAALNYVDADGVLIVKEGAKRSVVVPPAPSSQPGAGSSLGLVAINLGTPTTTTNGTPAGASVSINGVSQAASLERRLLQKLTSTNQSAPAPAAIDTLIGLGLSTTKKSSSGDLITDLAKSLLGGNNS